MVKVVAEARGKVILMGEHAVVYGHPALAAQVDLPLVVTLKWQDTPPPIGGRWALRCHLPALGEPLPPMILAETRSAISLMKAGDHSGHSALYDALTLCFKLADAPPGTFDLSLNSALPMGKGMGSSAAFAAAILRAISQLKKVDPEAHTLAQWVNEVEAIFHGTPSGVDGAVVSHGGLLRFQRGEPSILEPLTLPRALPIVLADSGDIGETSKMVGAVRQRLESQPEDTRRIFEEIEALTLEGLEAMSRGDLMALGPLMVANHDRLREIGVSTPTLDSMVTLALEAGALGAKLTGAGGGGLMMALVKDDTQAARVAGALSQAGYTTWLTSLGA